MTIDEIAKAEGYSDAQNATEAIKVAQHWFKRNPGRRPPKHIERAIRVTKRFQLHQQKEQEGIQKRLDQLSRRPRFFFGAIAESAKGKKFRRWTRRKLGLYLTLDQMVEHFAYLLSADAVEHYGKIKTTKERGHILAGMATAVNVLYGLAEQGDRAPLPSVVAHRALTRENNV